MSRKYREAAAKMQQNVQKHLKEMKELSSSEDEDICDPSLLEGVLQSYKNGGGDARMLQRTKNLLEDTISGRSVTCLICIGSIKRHDAIWTCGHCHSYFHLSCVQKWGNDCTSLRTEEYSPVSLVKPRKIEWCCPKCRHSYTKDEIPRKYLCFCAKAVDPPFHPWLIPHSCGEVCEKKLSLGDNCKHLCLLLCHPGPCPPCPQMVNGVCYCQKERKKVRCSLAKWSCGQKCCRILSCKSHKCENICHDGECPSCSYTSIQSCQCGSEKVKRPCNDPQWRCLKPCNKLYSCGYHKCEQICHSGDCGVCPNSGMHTCPCGSNQRYVECPDIIESCVSTCGKKHDDCEHTCSEKCHKGPCPPCLVLVEKQCQCGTHTKSLPCHKEYRCDVKCRGMRDCGKHPCSKKCCNGNCPPCEKICDKPLQCGRHKCTAVCHSGPCYPCPREAEVTCRCKKTSVTVPCGREKHTKPPKCNIPCKIKYKCKHTTENIHTCHFGDCPPCKAICEKVYECGHKCSAICHQFVSVTFKQVEKPATPWEIQPSKTQIVNLACLPCETPVTVCCFGGHDNTEQPCHIASRYSCGRICGQQLPCTNHDCSMLCHLLEPDPDYPNVPSACETCDQSCQYPRPNNCIHPCPIEMCHPGECPPCVIVRKLLCHCGLTEMYISCKDLETATDETFCCKLQCPKNMPCGHRCKLTCHPRACPEQVCTKKIKVYCVCGNLKKEISCNAKDGKNIACDESCEAKMLAAKLEREIEEKRQKELEEEKNKRELAEYEWKMSGKKRKHKEKRTLENKDNRNFLQKYCIPLISAVVFILAAAYYIFVLQDWP